MPPLPVTVPGTWARMRRERPTPHECANEIGIEPDKEQQLLAAWRQRAGSR